MENIWVGISIQRSPYFLRSKRWWADSTKKNTEIRNGWESKSLCAFLHQLPFLSSQFPWSCMSQVAVLVMLPFIMPMNYQPFLLVYWSLTSVFSAQSKSKLLAHPTANTHTFMLICTVILHLSLFEADWHYHGSSFVSFESVKTHGQR